MFFYRLIFMPFIMSSVLGYFDESLVSSMKGFIKQRYREVEQNQQDTGTARSLESDKLKGEREEMVVNKIFNAISRDLVLNHRDLIEAYSNSTNSSSVEGPHGINETDASQSMPAAIWNYLKGKLAGLSHSIISTLFGDSQNTTNSSLPYSNSSVINQTGDTVKTENSGSINKKDVSYYHTPKRYFNMRRNRVPSYASRSKVEPDNDMMNPDGIDDSSDLEEDPAFWDKLKRLVSEVGSRKHIAPTSNREAESAPYAKVETPSGFIDAPEIEKSTELKPVIREPAKSWTTTDKMTVGASEDIGSALKEKDAMIKMMNGQSLETPLTTPSMDLSDQNVPSMSIADPRMLVKEGLNSMTMYSHWNFKDIRNDIVIGTPGKSMKLMGAAAYRYGSVDIPNTSNSYIDSGDYHGTCVSDPELCSNGISFQITFKLQPSSVNNSVESVFDTGASSPDSRGFGLYRLTDGSILAQVSSSTGRWCARFFKSGEEIKDWITATITWDRLLGLNFYVNCRLISASSSPGTCSPCTDCHKQDFHTSLKIGRMNNGLNPITLPMLISDFEIHDKALSSMDVAEKCGLLHKKQYPMILNKPNTFDPVNVPANVLDSTELAYRRSLLSHANMQQSGRNNMYWKKNMAQFRQKSDALYNLIRFDDISRYADPQVYYLKKRSV